MRKRRPAPAKFDRRPAAERAREALAEEQRRSKTFSGLTVVLPKPYLTESLLEIVRQTLDKPAHPTAS